MNRALVGAGLLQLMAVFMPAARVRVVGTMPFFRLPTAGWLLVALAFLTIATALVPHRWWRWVPGVLSALVVAVVYERIVNAPSGFFIDPLVRRLVHPAWGFVPMCFAVILALAANAHGMYAMQSISTRKPSPGSAAA